MKMLPKLSFSLLFLPLLSQAAGAPGVKPEELSRDKRESLYEENGMAYAKGLYLENNGTPDDDLRSRKGEALNQSIRQRGINKLEAYLRSTQDRRIRREILHRLSQLYEQQAEVISRRNDVKDKNPAIFAEIGRAHV